MAYNVYDPNTTAVSSLYTQQIASLHDFFEPQVIPTLYARFGQQYMPMFTQFLAMQRAQPVSGPSWYGWEENWYHQSILAGSTTTAGAAGAGVNITVDPSQVDSDGNYYPQVGMIITFPNYVQGQITSINDTSGVVLTVTPTLAANSIPAVTAGDTLAITTNAFGDGTDQPLSTVVGATKRTFYAQIFKTTVGAEGSQLTNQKWITKIDDGRSVKDYYSPGYMRGEYLRDLFIDGAFTWGDETDNITVAAGGPGAGNSISTTKGLFRWAQEGGYDLGYTAGSWAPTNLDEVGLYQLSQGVTSGYSFDMIGAKLNIDIENGMSTDLQNTGVDYTNATRAIFRGDEKLAASFGFKTINKGGVVHLLHVMPQWSMPQTWGATGYNMAQWGLFMPLSKFVDPKTDLVMDNVAVRYEAMDGYSRMFEAWTIAGAGPGPKYISIDKTDTFLRSHMGLQVFKANQFVYTHP